MSDVRPGQYRVLDRTWEPDDRIHIEFDFRFHFWAKDGAPSTASIYRGPILLAYDPRFNANSEMPTLRAKGLAGRRIEPDSWLKPCLLMEFTAEDGRAVRLCDFGSAGNAGHAYRSWLPVTFEKPPKCEFSQENPLRSVRY